MELCNRLIKTYPNHFDNDFNFDEWVKGGNVILFSEQDVALFEKKENNTYVGHYFLHSSFKRSLKDKLKICKSFLRQMFKEYNASVIFGETPKTNKAALLVSRKLGFTYLGEVLNDNGDECVMCYMLNPNKVD